MGRRRLQWLLLGACALLLALPAFAAGATLNWEQPADFSTSGANPDHDAYGGAPWSYDEGPTCTGVRCTPSHDPSGFTRFTNFSSGAWSDTPARFIGPPASGTLQMGATSSGLTVLGWTNPLGHQANVSVTGTIGAGTGTCDWSLDQGGTSSQSGSGSGSIADALTVPPGGSIYLTLSAQPALVLDATCTAPVTLHITEADVPPVTLDPPATASPLTSSSPVLTGHSAGDATTVAVAVYAGPAATGAPVRVLSTTRNATGSFAATVTPPLADGQYTAVAAQRGSQPGISDPVTFRIKAHAPTLTVAAPQRGGSAFGPHPTFLGRGGSSLGDDSTVSVTLHRGSSSTGANLGTEAARITGGSWTLKWAKALHNGFYTLVAQQSDDAGHTILQYVSFVVVPTPPVIGSRVSLRGTTASVAITCTAPSGTCLGTVLALSANRLRTRSGGPLGYVRVIFAYARIAAGRTAMVRSTLPGYVAATLRRVHRLQVRVSVSMVGIGHASATRSAGG